MKNLKSSVLFKSIIIIILSLILLIPSTMVSNLVQDRERMQRLAISEVSTKWSNAQTITGPFISVPFDRFEKRFNRRDSAYEVVSVQEWAHFFPEQLTITGTINPEKRYRGIYEVVVYDAKLHISGNFNNIDFERLDIHPKNVHFDKAMLNLGISDLKGIDKQVAIEWDGNAVPFDAGTSSKQVVNSGIHALVPITTTSTQDYQFATEISLKGSQHLYFTPVGKTTNVQLSSDWKTPSFTGNYLPNSRQVNDEGFNAKWQILHLNRNFSQQWIANQYSVKHSSFGTDLLLPVDKYTKSYRVANYAMLFIILTFVTFFFVEVMKKVFIHPIQYLLVGVAIIVFYTLLLAFSEHIGFNMSYILSVVLTLALVTAYTTAILKSRNLGGLILGILLILYTFIFIIIQLEDYALLIGSVGMFIILAIIMYMSRKIDWYDTNLGPTNPKP